MALLLQAATPDAAADERYCASASSEQPLRFCLADRRHALAERALAAALRDARRGAAAQQRANRAFIRANGGVTLVGDAVRALEMSQRSWSHSFRDDCLAVGLAVTTGNAGTEGVTAARACEADRMLERVRFLNVTYGTGE